MHGFLQMDVRPKGFSIIQCTFINNLSRFNATRYPTKPSDTAEKFDPSTNNHFIFIRKNKLYEVQVVQNGKELSLAELEAQIRQVYEAAGESLGTPIGVLTSENRDIWTDVRIVHAFVYICFPDFCVGSCTSRFQPYQR